MLEQGQPVPLLKGTTGTGEELSLEGLSGQWAVLYFYPKDNTPGCISEAQSFRDLYPEFQRRNAQIVGVSRDSPASHERFAGKQSLPFPLVSDADEVWCRAFDVIHEKMLYGNRHMGIVRSTFLINPDGVLVREWRGVKVPGHAEAVLAALPVA